MILQDVLNSSTTRISEVRSLHTMIDRLTTNAAASGTPASDPSLVMIKGLLFVHLYGVLEYTVSQTVQRVIREINNKSCQVADFKRVFLSIALHSECDSLASVGASKTWERRKSLFDKIDSAIIVPLNDSIMPTDGKNIKYAQLQSIWDTFCVKDPILPDLRLGNRIKTVVGNRNLIAHGSESPIEVGRNYTPSDLIDFVNDIDRVCTHIIQTFETYLVRQDYLT